MGETRRLSPEAGGRVGRSRGQNKGLASAGNSSFYIVFELHTAACRSRVVPGLHLCAEPGDELCAFLVPEEAEAALVRVRGVGAESLQLLHEPELSLGAPGQDGVHAQRPQRRAAVAIAREVAEREDSRAPGVDLRLCLLRGQGEQLASRQRDGTRPIREQDWRVAGEGCEPSENK